MQVVAIVALLFLVPVFSILSAIVIAVLCLVNEHLRDHFDQVFICWACLCSLQVLARTFSAAGPILWWRDVPPLSYSEEVSSERRPDKSKESPNCGPPANETIEASTANTRSDIAPTDEALELSPADLKLASVRACLRAFEQTSMPTADQKLCRELVQNDLLAILALFGRRATPYTHEHVSLYLELSQSEMDDGAILRELQGAEHSSDNPHALYAGFWAITLKMQGCREDYWPLSSALKRGYSATAWLASHWSLASTFETGCSELSVFVRLNWLSTRKVSEKERAAFSVLGLEPGASADQIRTAQRRAVTQWHPDRLNGMAPELIEIATRRLAEINVAARTSSEFSARLWSLTYGL